MKCKKLIERFLIALGLCSLIITVSCGSDDDDDEDTPAVRSFSLKGGAGTSLLANLATTTDPREAYIKIYKFAVSASDDCSDLDTIIDNGDTPSSVNLNSTPDLGSGEIADGTYPCVAIEMSDTVTFKPNESLTTCDRDTSYTLDVCSVRDGTAGSSTMIDGTSVTCTTEENRVTMYLSTLSGISDPGTEPCSISISACNAFVAPTADSSNNGLKLTNALVVEGDTSGTFTMNASGKVQDRDNGENADPSCDMQPPIWSFQ